MYNQQQAYGVQYGGQTFGAGAPPMAMEPAKKPRRRGAGPLAVTLIVLLTLVIGLIGGAAAYYFLIDRYMPLPQQPVPATLTLEELDEVVVGTYTYQGKVYQINARQAILDSVSLSAMLNDDGTYDAPTADMVLSYARNHILAQAVADGLGLKNVHCVNARAESLGQTFDWVVTRAVASLADLYPWVKGRFRRSVLCLKGGQVLQEISELSRKWGVDPGRVRLWSIEEWLNDEYFKEKFVIEIGKSYLCPPKSD